MFPLGSHLNPYNEYADHSYLGPNIGNEMNVLHTHYLPAFVLHTAFNRFDAGLFRGINAYCIYYSPKLDVFAN